MVRILFLLAFLVFPGSVRAADPAVPAGKRANPDYLAWCNFPKGTAITVEEICEGCIENQPRYSSKVFTTTTTTLMAVSPDHLELEITKTRKENDQKEVAIGPWKIKYLRFIDLPRVVSQELNPIKLLDEGDDTLKVEGKSYKAKYSKTEEGHFDAEGSTLTIRSWKCETVPGGVIKLQREMTGTTGFDSTELLVKIVLPAK